MRHISIEPPPFFHRGPSPLARLAFFGLLSLALLFADTRYRYLESVRHAVAIVLYPLQRAVQLPGEAMAWVGSYFSSQRTLAGENAALKQQLLARRPRRAGVHAARAGERAAARAARGREAHSRATRSPPRSCTPAAIRSRRSSSSTRARRQAFSPGQAVIDEIGVVGQVTRVFPYMSEVTLVTDKDHAVPVRVERSGVRSVMYGCRHGPARPSFASCRRTPKSSPAIAW